LNYEGRIVWLQVFCIKGIVDFVVWLTEGQDGEDVCVEAEDYAPAVVVFEEMTSGFF